MQGPLRHSPRLRGPPTRKVNTLAYILGFVIAAPAPGQAPAPAPAPTPLPSPAALSLARASQSPVIDGSLDDSVWGAATLVDTFYETAFGDNRKPMVDTLGYLLYDDKYIYVGFRCADPDPGKIRAPFTDRDTVSTADDYVTVMIDARNDRRTAQLFRVTPRGVQADAIFNDATGLENLSPDFYFDSAAKISAQGWEAELRIPLSSLRYGKGDSQGWGILLRRNYPRDRRYSIFSSPIPRDYNCIVCHSSVLGSISNLPSSNHIVIAPYVAVQGIATAPEPGAPLGPTRGDADAGLDVKFNFGSNLALDATIRPDFSQVEADVAQIAVNNRFALFFPEKRPFFLEGFDLFDTPIQAVYTRTLTSPQWGGRATGKAGSTSYTVFGAEDRGGGLVILPGPTGSEFAAQDFRSKVGVARVRTDLGASFVGFLATGRAVDGGGHNVVAGPDFQWRHGGDQVGGQFLYSNTETPVRPQLADEWDGRKLRSHALTVQWDRTARSYGVTARYNDFGDGFRADNGFVPQVGYRQAFLAFGGTIYKTKSFFSLLNPQLIGELTRDREGATINQHLAGNFVGFGKKNSYINVGGAFDKVRTGGVLFDVNQVTYLVQVDPSRRLPRISAQGYFGQQVDFENTRQGRGGAANITARIRPTIHLSLELVSSREWLNVDDPLLGSGRLFTAQVQRLKATWNFDRRLFVRAIGQWVDTHRDPLLYISEVRRREGDFQGSVLVGYRLNWQSALFLGYGDNRALDQSNRLDKVDRQLFVKMSYAWQH